MALATRPPNTHALDAASSRTSAGYALHCALARAPWCPPSSNSCSCSSLLNRCSRLQDLHVPHASGGDMPGSSSYGGRPHNNGGSYGGGMSRRSKTDRARKPGLFEIKVMTPPPRSLGIYALPPNTHNGEEIEIDGQGYVVTSLVLKYKLVKGRYVRDHSRLEVQPTSRYFLNMMLDNLVSARYIGPIDTGSQD